MQNDDKKTIIYKPHIKNEKGQEKDKEKRESMTFVHIALF